MQTLIFFLQEKKLKVFQKLDINIVYFEDLLFGLQQLVCIHTYQETRMKEALFQTEALENYIGTQDRHFIQIRNNTS